MVSADIIAQNNIGIRLFKELAQVDSHVDILKGLDAVVASKERYTERATNAFQPAPQSFNDIPFIAYTAEEQPISAQSKSLAGVADDQPRGVAPKRLFSDHIRDSMRVSNRRTVPTAGEYRESDPNNNNRRCAPATSEYVPNSAAEYQNRWGSESMYDSFQSVPDEIPCEKTEGAAPAQPEASIKKPPAAADDDVETFRAKQHYLALLEKIKRQGVKPSREYSLADTLDDIRYEYELHQMNLDTLNHVGSIKNFMSMGLRGVELLNGHFGPLLPLDGISKEFDKVENSNRLDQPLERLYVRLWRRGHQSPWLELGWFFLTFFGVFILKNLIDKKFSGSSSGKTSGSGGGGGGGFNPMSFLSAFRGPQQQTATTPSPPPLLNPEQPSISAPVVPQTSTSNFPKETSENRKQAESRPIIARPRLQRPHLGFSEVTEVPRSQALDIGTTDPTGPSPSYSPATQREPPPTAFVESEDDKSLLASMIRKVRDFTSVDEDD